jgi:isoleucyl-tRNA synthetase
MDQLFTDLNRVTGKEADQSVHIANFPVYDQGMVDKELEERMDIAQKISSMVLGLRRKEKLRVRQPLAKIVVPVLNPQFGEQLDAVKNIILSEINVKEIEYLSGSEGVIKKKIKPNFKTLGPKYSKLMKQISAAIAQMGQADITAIEVKGSYAIEIENETIVLTPEDVEILSEDIPGWLVASEGALTVALDIHVTEELRQEGIAREFVNRIQNIRKESDFEVTDKIRVQIQKNDLLNEALEKHAEYISNQTLASSFVLVDSVKTENARQVDIDEVVTYVVVEKQ